MVCVPLFKDQTLVAYRIADELGLGVKVDYTSMKVEDIRRAMHKIFDDGNYYKRSDYYSKLSRDHPGFLNGAEIIQQFLVKKNL